MTEQALKDSHRLLQMLIDTIEGEVFVKDGNGKYLFVNKAFGNDFGVDPNQVFGKDDYFVFSPEIAAKLQENDKRIMAAKKAENIEERGVIKGRHVTYLTNKVPLIDGDGNVIGICGVGFDITRQKEMETALKEAHLDMERRVKERTAQLSETVDKLSEAELRYRTDVRIIAATNRNLEEDVRKKQFRMDLWYRLSVFAITIPPLRERFEEIEREHILLALRKTNWRIHGEDGAAALLDINPSTLRGRMRKQGINRPPYKT